MVKDINCIYKKKPEVFSLLRGGQQGIDERALPKKFEIDWVRYYQER